MYIHIYSRAALLIGGMHCVVPLKGVRYVHTHTYIYLYIYKFICLYIYTAEQRR